MAVQLWTENWMGWFDSWGGSPAGDWPSFEATGQSEQKAFGIFRWVARGGSHVNFYNWAGGNHFGRNAGSSMVNVYYWKAPIAADNLKQGAERRHMARAYAAIAEAAGDILGTAAQLRMQKNVSVIDPATGKPLPGQAYIYVYGAAAFLERPNGRAAGTIEWEGVKYAVPGFSSSLVKGGRTLFNTADVQGGGAVHRWTPVPGFTGWKTWRDTAVADSASALPPPSPPAPLWSGSALGRVVRSAAPMEAVNFSEYDSEITIYACELSAGDVAAAAESVNLTLASAKAQAWTVFVNGKLVGGNYEVSHSSGTSEIVVAVPALRLQRPPEGAAAGSSSLLVLVSTSLGIDNGGGVRDGVSTGVKGITSSEPGSVMLGSVDLTARTWTHIAGSAGEAKAVYTEAGAGSVAWAPLAGATTAGAMTWLTAAFEAPASVLAPDSAGEMNSTLNLDVVGLGRGRFYINGMDLGRYWSKVCKQDICQRYYPIPFDILKPPPALNTLTILDELGVSNITSVGLAVSTDGQAPPCNHPAAAGDNASTVLCGGASAALVIKRSADGASTVSPQSSPSLCLTAVAKKAASAAQSAPNAAAWQPCSSGSAAQQWAIQSGTVKPAGEGGLCLDITNQVLGANVVLDIWKCNGGANQQWSVHGDTLVSGFDEVCVGYTC